MKKLYKCHLPQILAIYSFLVSRLKEFIYDICKIIRNDFYFTKKTTKFFKLR
ncbi:hypothetical protein RhiirC2_386238 [Rhizophagus irregularis]|uniref:Uncharacterized protein n=1 Tax=Rhizophagus irregularis TaxID=588596 RepID=A0A2N1NER2_9GLOM|nr:hypothetical protein RhiirC2_386238 [Rhizophagus irregularis]